MCITYSLILVPSILFTIYIADVISVALTVISIVSLALLLGCYSFAACSDPGVVFRDPDDYGTDPERGSDSKAMGTNMKYNNVATIECSQCNMMRPCTAMHCYECGVCVEEVSSCKTCLASTFCRGL